MYGEARREASRVLHVEVVALQYDILSQAIEVEVTARVIKRLPIYAALGVAELWRHDGLRLTGLALVNGTYEPAETGAAFSFLKIGDLNYFLDRSFAVRKNVLLREFRDWVRAGM